jgi:fatty-acyl-CoA synthase
LSSQRTLGTALSSLCRQPSAQARTVGFPTAAGLRRLTLEEVESASARFARGLLSEGIGRGALVGMLVDVGPDLLRTLFGIVRAGAAATVLPVTSADVPRQARRLKHFIDAGAIRVVVADPAHQELAFELRRCSPGLRLLGTGLAGAGGGVLPSLGEDELAVVQYTSGSTATPRGVMLSHRSILAGLAAIAVSARTSPRDVWVQWAPPYHDLGLLACSPGSCTAAAPT